MTPSVTTIAEFRIAVKAAQNNLIAEDRLIVRGKEVTALARIQKRTSLILIPLGIGGFAVIYVAGLSRLGGHAFVSLSALLAALAVTVQLRCVWAEMRYRARMAWNAACDVMRLRNTQVSQESEQVGHTVWGDQSYSKIAIKNLIKLELMSFCSRRHIPCYAPFSRFALIALLVAFAVTTLCAMKLHMWDTWPPVSLPFIACIFFWFFAVAAMHGALMSWLEDIVTCGLVAVTLGDQGESR
jgi:hypothetical protein